MRHDRLMGPTFQGLVEDVAKECQTPSQRHADDMSEQALIAA